MAIFNTLLEISVYSGIIFFVTMFIKKAFKNKMSPLLHFAIWAVFLLRLMIPVTLDAPMHVFTYPTNPAVTPIHTSAVAPVNNVTDYVTPSTETTEQTRVDTITVDSSATFQTFTPDITPALLPAALTATQILLIVWLGGTAIGLAYIAALTILLTRKIKHKSAPASTHLIKLLDDVKAELHMKAKLKLVCQYEYGSPALMFPRTILIPMDKLAVLDDEQIKNCLRHECMHYKRGDHFMSLFLTVLNAVYWFNPFMWLTYFEIRKDMETACDSGVVKRLEPSERRHYAELILKLSGQSRHMQLALGMAQSRKNAERRIKGVFMAHTTKLGVKFISFVLSALLFFCCFTTACQPTPAEPVVVNKSGGISAEMIADTLPPGAVKEVDAPSHWTETMTRQNGHMEINADVDVIIPENLSNTPVNKVEQITLTPERLQQLTSYFVGDSKLYKPLPLNKFDGLIQLEKIKDGAGSYGQYYEEARGYMAEKLQEMIDAAPVTAEKTYTDLSFTQPYNSDNHIVIDAWLKAVGTDGILKPEGEKYVGVFAQTGEDYEPMISASTYDSYAVIPSRFNYSYPGSILTADDIKQTVHDQEMYHTAGYPLDDPLKNYLATSNQYYAELEEVMNNNIIETPEQAMAAAQKALDDLGISDLILDYMDKGVWLPRQPQDWDEFSTPTSEAKGGYNIVFARSAGQLAGYRQNYGGMSATDMLTYTPPFGVEQVSIFISNGKILQFDWRNMARATETTAANTTLLPFDEIKSRLADYLSYNFAYQGPEVGSFSIDIVDVELRASQITAKDDPFRSWLVPTWLFKIRMDYSNSNNTSTMVTGDYPCEINALDGGIIIPH